MLPQDLISQIIHGDCLEVMKGIPDNSIDTVITDPPYHLVSINKRFRKTSLSDDNKTGKDARNGNHQYARLSKGFMGKDWDGGGIAFNLELWAEVLRIAKPGAFLFAFGGTRTYHRLTCAIEDAGWEIRDCMMWLYGQGFPKSLNVSKSIDQRLGTEREIIRPRTYELANDGGYSGGLNTSKPRSESCEITAPASPQAQLFDGYGSALKPAWEPIIVAMKPVDETFANNALKWGVSGLWIDGGRVPTNWDTDPTRRGWQGGDATKSESIFGNNGNERVSFANSLGRYPANLLLSCHCKSDQHEEDCPVRMLDEQSGVMKRGSFRRNSSQDRKAISTRAHNPRSPNQTDSVCDYGDSGGASRFFYIAKTSRSERGDYNNHPTVKPLSLLEYLCKLSRTPTGGIILDPFGGSGSTALAAIKTNRQYIIIEKELEYVEIARKRVAEVKATQMELPQ